MRRSLLLTAMLLPLVLLNRAGMADQLSLSIESIGTDHPSSFPKLLRTHLVNPAYTPVNLIEAVASSLLIVDGKTFHRADAPFKGPPGIAPKGSWDGCLSPLDYTPQLTPGAHKIRLKLGGQDSEAITMRWFEPIAWQKGTMKTRQQEIDELAETITKGMPRSCVEQWLTEIDGGFQEGKRVRYFLEPQFKVVVPYSEGTQPGSEQEVVSGAVKIYSEARIQD